MKKLYVAPKVRIYPTREAFYLWQDHKREWKRRGSHCYQAPRIQIFSSWKEKHLHQMAQVAEQQSRDQMQVIILVALWASKIRPVSERALSCNNSNGIVEIILSYEIGRFISACLKKERECTFESLYNWAIQFGRGNGITSWNKNCGKACRNLWKQIPKNLKKGGKISLGEVLYSTTDRDLSKVESYLEEKVHYYSSLRGKWAAKIAREADEDYYYVFGK